MDRTWPTPGGFSWIVIKAEGATGPEQERSALKPAVLCFLAFLSPTLALRLQQDLSERFPVTPEAFVGEGSKGCEERAAGPRCGGSRDRSTCPGQSMVWGMRLQLGCLGAEGHLLIQVHRVCPSFQAFPGHWEETPEHRRGHGASPSPEGWSCPLTKHSQCSAVPVQSFHGGSWCGWGGTSQWEHREQEKALFAKATCSQPCSALQLQFHVSSSHFGQCEHQKKPVNTSRAGIALLLSSIIPSTHQRGQHHSGLLQSKGILPLPPPARSHGAHPRSCQWGTRNANSIPGSPNPLLFMAAPSLAAQARSKAMLLTICFMFSLYPVVPLHSCHRNMSLLIRLKGKKTTKPSEEPPRLLPVPHVEAEGRRSH